MSDISGDIELSQFGNIFSLNGKVAVITGGSRGLGLSVASGFLQAGCEKVFIVSRKSAACEAAAALLNKLPQKKESSVAIPLAFDLSKVDEIDKLVSEISARTQHLDILFANAGASWGATFENQPEHAFTKVMDLNVKSIFYTVQKLQPLLRRGAAVNSPSNVIINSSAAGLGVGTLGEHGTHPYSVSKAAAIHLARILAVELGPRGINTNAICPGFFPTKMSSGLISLEGGLDTQAARSPNGRLGMPEDIVGLVVFLASRAASHINGAVIALDGGAHLGNGKL